MAPTSASFENMLARLASEHKLDLRGYKTSTLRRRTRRRMEQLRIAEHDEYMQYVEKNPGEVNELLYAVLINVTKFFRDLTAWHVLARDVLPMLFQNHPAGETFKIWSAGCSTGEEAYSAALLVADYLGPKLKEHDVKIYATDNDEQALQVARKGQYPVAAMSGIPPEFRKNLVITGDTFRLERDVRRLVIFGRSNVTQDAPISHVNLLICRNLLIYFDPSAQQNIMGRFRYAVEPGGVLFLGKSESQLRSSPHFRTLNSRWRIFQRTSVPSPLERPSAGTLYNVTDKSHLNERAQEELALLRAYHSTLLETLDPGIVILDSEDNVINENESSRKMWQAETMMMGGKIGESSLMRKCPDLRHHLDASRNAEPRSVNFDCSTPGGLELAVTVRPIVSQSPEKALLGTLIYMEDVTPREHLQQTVEELQTTAEELQSTNEELETTNEELQSTNEELETTNEELQSTNEELETTNEELKSLNEELEDINEELAKRSRQLDEFTVRYSEMVEQMPWPLVLARADGTINVYNSAAQKLFGFATPSVNGMNLLQMPMTKNNHVDLGAHIKRAAVGKENITVEDFELSTNAGIGAVRLHIRPMPVGEAEQGALVMFEPMFDDGLDGDGKAAKPRSGNGRSSSGRGVKGSLGNGSKSAANKATRKTAKPSPKQTKKSKIAPKKR